MRRRKEGRVRQKETEPREVRQLALHMGTEASLLFSSSRRPMTSAPRPDNTPVPGHYIHTTVMEDRMLPFAPELGIHPSLKSRLCDGHLGTAGCSVKCSRGPELPLETR